MTTAFFTTLLLGLIKSTSAEPPIRVCQFREYPYIVSVRFKISMKHLASGSIVSPRWSLTAAHAVSRYTETPQFIIVTGGFSNLNDFGNFPQNQAKAVVKHPDFDPSSNNFDAALILLELVMDMVLTHLKQVKLPEHQFKGDLENFCSQGTVLGWAGITKDRISSRGISNLTLTCMDVNIITTEACMVKAPAYALEPDMFCGIPTGKDEKADSCFGDRGGPVMCEDTQVGLMIFTAGCSAVSDQPSAYLRIDTMLVFIRETIMSSAGGKTCFGVAWCCLLRLV